MLRRIGCIAVLLAVLGALPASAAPSDHPPRLFFPHHRECHSVRCAHAGDRAFARHEEKLRRRREARERRQMHTALASWYEDGGSTASGFHAALGFAHLGPGEGGYPGMAFGTRVRFCAASCATGTMDDHGPYVSGREFDLDAALKSALGCSDLCRVRWRIVG